MNRHLVPALAALLALTLPVSASAHQAHKHPEAHAAHGAGSAHEPAPTGDAAVDITAKLKAMFETEGNPLAVEPVVVAGDWAIAGWIQDGKGGRALLKRKGEGWSIHLCSGDSLKEAAVLTKIGIPASDAEHLAHHLAEAEKPLPAETLALFASFEGTVMVEGAEGEAGHAHGHGDSQHKP
ncbi:copper uptake system-associated protein [Rhizobium sp. AQ_MP]|uniref:copper uptake system-associated protein n=1 Tax=Rhizobium sp. AQ_MP TaxID=2761536 RepID=UPI001FEE31CD|nr:copper uptake system-associated protein [Rhizobium sp. AQ_MP]